MGQTVDHRYLKAAVSPSPWPFQRDCKCFLGIKVSKILSKRVNLDHFYHGIVKCWQMDDFCCRRRPIYRYKSNRLRSFDHCQMHFTWPRTPLKSKKIEHCRALLGVAQPDTFSLLPRRHATSEKNSAKKAMSDYLVLIHFAENQCRRKCISQKIDFASARLIVFQNHIKKS